MTTPARTRTARHALRQALCMRAADQDTVAILAERERAFLSSLAADLVGIALARDANGLGGSRCWEMVAHEIELAEAKRVVAERATAQAEAIRLECDGVPWSQADREWAWAREEERAARCEAAEARWFEDAAYGNGD